VTGPTAPYVTDEAEGNDWRALLGDSCERLAELPDNSVSMSVQSPPFDSLYVYSPSMRDLGNSLNREEFLAHYSFIITEQLRVTKPGRMSCVHVQQVAVKKSVTGYIGLTDFRGDVIRAHQAAGWIYFGEATIWKDPQAQSIRLKVQQLAFKSKNVDSARIRPALADYLLIFRKPGENEVRIPHEVGTGDFTNDDWIEWASPIWSDHHEGGWLDGDGICPVWWGIRETETLNTRAARDDPDERHIAPLQLEFIRRCVIMYSNPGELILSPFMGIGSEGFIALTLGRRFVGIELKASYWKQAVANLRRAERDSTAPSLFDGAS
jgi:hypothetical protein